MRKFIVPIINLINIILVSITFGLLSKPAIVDVSDAPKGNFYQIAWGHPGNASTAGIIAFFLFVVAVALTLIVFFPFKARKCVSALNGGLYVAAGVLFLLCRKYVAWSILKPELTGAIIASAVLVFVAGALSIGMSVIEFAGKKESK